MVHFLQNLAQSIDIQDLPGGSQAQNGGSNLGSSTVQTGLDIFYVIAGAVGLLVITIAGFRMILARGNPQQIAQARTIILYTLIGLVVIVAAGTIVGFVINSGI